MPREKRGGQHPFFKQGKNLPEVIAHRGGAGEWPGETIYAFEEALKAGADVLEMDIRYTSDGDLVLMHDANVKGTTGVDRRVVDLTSAEIQKLDAAHRWRQAGKVFPPGAKLGVPRLEDVFRSFPGVRMNIEIKPIDDNEYILVEIEKPQDAILTKGNNFTSRFVHAYGQVLDFQEWVDAHGEYARSLMPGIFSPKGVLIIGMRKDLSVEQIAKLKRFSINSRSIEVLTYDDLIRKARDLYENIYKKRS